EVDVFHLEVELCRVKIDSLGRVFVVNLAVVDVDKGNGKRRRSALAGALFLFFLRFFFFLFLAPDGGEVELAAFIPEDVDHRAVEDHVPNLQLSLEQQRQELHIDLQIGGADERLVRKSGIVGKRELLQAHADAAP